MKYITKEVRIGIAGIAALCILVYGINYLKGIHMFKPSSYFYAKFQNVNGLTKSSPVFADGVRVGIVRDIYYDYVNPGNVIVEVELDTELRIHRNVRRRQDESSSCQQSPREVSGRRYDSRHSQQRNDGESGYHDAATGKDAAQTGFYPRLFKYGIGRPRHTCHPAQCAEPDRQPGRNQRTTANIDE